MQGISVARTVVVILKCVNISFTFQLKAFLNPGLSECGDVCAGKKPITLYVRAEGPSDTLHYLWDLTGHPAVLLAVTSPSAKIHINWSPYLLHLPQSVNFTEKPQYTFGLEIQKVSLVFFNKTLQIITVAFEISMQFPSRNVS